MDISFHYFAVKTLALKAGFDAASAQTIAVFSQYIDDYNAYTPRNYSNIPSHFKSNTSPYDVYVSDSPANFNPPTTGFVDFLDLASLLLPRPQKFTVLPFHFIPRTAADIRIHQLVTQEASLGDGSVIAGCLAQASTQYGNATTSGGQRDALMRVGMLLHTFADTCAHQKFSGIFEENNDVDLITVIDNASGTDVTDSYRSYIERYLAEAARVVKKIFLRIGHGMVGHVPDFTHITWEMGLHNGQRYRRDNTTEFIHMGRKIFNYLRQLRGMGEVSQAEWDPLAASLRQAFYCNISNDSIQLLGATEENIQSAEEQIYRKLKSHWATVFPDYANDYFYDKQQVFPGALSYNLRPLEMNAEGFYLFVQYAEDLLIQLYGNRPRFNTGEISNTCDFVCANPGENSNAVSTTGLQVDAGVQINGNSDLSQIVRFNDGGCVYGIKLTLNSTSASVYNYEIQVDGCGPKGAGSGSGHLYFTDKTGDTYSLSIYRSGRHIHVVDYRSVSPEITTITWSN